MLRRVLGCTCALALTGCGLEKLPPDYADARDTAFYGVPVQMDATAAIERIGLQNQYFLTLAGRPIEKQPPEKAGQLWPILPPDEPKDPEKNPDRLDWPSVTARGLADIDAVCTNYFKRLDDYADYQKSLRDGTGIVGSATTTIMAALDAATSGIAIVSGLFGVSQGLMDTTSQAALFSVDPTKLYNLHTKAAAAYRQKKRPSVEQIASVGEAADMLGGYVTLCTPVALKGLTSESIEQVRIDATPDGRVGVIGAGTSALFELNADDLANRTGAEGPRPDFRNGARTEFERSLDPSYVQNLQQSLCVQPDGIIGRATRDALASAHAAFDDGQARTVEADREFDRTLIANIRRTPQLQGPCPTGYRDVYERINYDRPADQLPDLRDRLAAAVTTLGLGMPVPTPLTSLDQARPVIAAVARRCSLDSGERLTKQIDGIANAIETDGTIPRDCTLSN